MSQSRSNRREFFRSSTAAALTAALVRNVAGANERLVVGLIGAGGPPFVRGKHVAGLFVGQGAEVAAIADIEVCHRSTTAAILGNLAMKTGRKLHWDADKEKFINDPEADKLLMKPYREPYSLDPV